MKAENDFRSTLSRMLEERCSKNPRYSLRSFARDLGMAPARLSDVLRGRYGISREAAATIAAKLGMSAGETALFCDQVESKHARNSTLRVAAARRLKQDYRQLSLDGFQVISDWHHYAILELCLTEAFKADPIEIAKKLGISPILAKAAIERLIRLDMLEEKRGTLRPTEGFTTSPTDIPSDAIKKFHRQILEKAIQAIDFQGVEERDFSSMVLAVDRAEIPEAKKAIKEFRRAFDKKFGSARRKTDVYCLATQFFSLQEQRKRDP